ncbi:MAG: hypothetical protein CMG62_10215 [Candidatus Marinimicrobia bacterium]|nr:hypothetical protein [Candidatus Neomarinimicrobiota bacterium]|tara:strand:+ start:4515 stop:5759 length:1245 start_codon:yes stop_codon:yes gene_type:complete
MYIFFVRRYNDIDHLAPIIYKIAKETNNSIEVYSLDLTLDIQNDFRLKYLKNDFEISSSYLFLSNPNNLKNYFIIYLFKIIVWFYHRVGIKNKLTKFIVRSFDANVLGKDWVVNFLSSKKIKKLIFDWQKPKSFIIKLILEAKKRKIPIIACPHGINLAINNLITKKSIKIGRDQDYGLDWKYFDSVATQFPLHKERISNNGFDKNKVKVLGSTRFCDEWLKVLKKLNKIQKTQKKSSDKINVVYMDHISTYRFIPNIVIDTINKLSDYSFINLIVKPTTGLSVKSKAKFVGCLNYENSPKINFAHDISSQQLINWADVIICTISSIGIEALLQNKTLIHPQFFHKNTLLYSEMNACCNVSSLDELEILLKKISSDKTFRTYSKKDVSNFLDYVVYGGKKNKDVLNNYMEYILV